MSSKLSRRMGMVLVALLMALLVVPANALASDDPVVLDYNPKFNPVADRTVHITVNKQDGQTYEFVKGAHLQIIDKETGEVAVWYDGDGAKHAMDWVSDGESFDSARGLDVDHPYILREVEAPEGYARADDVEFILRSINFETKGEVISGATTSDGATNAEFKNISGGIEVQSFVISLYDQPVAAERTITVQEERENNREVVTTKEETIERQETNEKSNEEVVVRTSEKSDSNTRTVVNTDSKANNNEVVTTTSDSNVVVTQNETQTSNVVHTSNSRTGGGSLTKTGDDTSYAPMVVIGIVGVALIAFALLRRRK